MSAQEDDAEALARLDQALRRHGIDVDAPADDPDNVERLIRALDPTPLPAAQVTVRHAGALDLLRLVGILVAKLAPELRRVEVTFDELAQADAPALVVHEDAVREVRIFELVEPEAVAGDEAPGVAMGLGGRVEPAEPGVDMSRPGDHGLLRHRHP